MAISNVSSGLRPGVCSSTTRPQAPFEGQMIYETDTNRVLVWDNAAWVIPNQKTTNPNGLELIKTDTITSGTSKEITGVFSSEFKNYKIVISNMIASGASGLLMRMGTNSSSIYYFGGSSVVYSSNTVATQSGAGASHWNTGIVIPDTNRGGGVIELQMPQQNQVTGFQSIGGDPRTNGSGGRSYSGYVNTTTQFTSFTFLTESTQTFSSCDIAVYGYRV